MLVLLATLATSFLVRGRHRTVNTLACGDVTTRMIKYFSVTASEAIAIQCSEHRSEYL